MDDRHHKFCHVVIHGRSWQWRWRHNWRWYHLRCHLHGLCHRYCHPTTTIVPISALVTMIVTFTIIIAMKTFQCITPSVIIAIAIVSKNKTERAFSLFLQNCRIALMMKRSLTYAFSNKIFRGNLMSYNHAL